MSELPLWRHQEDEVEGHWDVPGRALLWGMRTGKTRTIIKTAEKLALHKGIEGVLIMAPNGVHSNWIRRELPKWSREYTGAFWNSNLSREGDIPFHHSLDRVFGYKSHGLRYLAVNDEALINPRAQKAIQAFRVSCRDRILLVADESSLFRRPGAQRTRLIRGLAQKFVYKRILDGTAIFNSPLHAFSQYEILRKEALGFRTFKEFKQRYAVYMRQRRGNGRSFERLTGYQNMDELREKLAYWSSVVMREDCDDMPELIRAPREVVMSDKQRKAYKQMVDQLLVEIGDQEIEALHGGAKVLKLQQILGGYIMDARGNVVNIDEKPPILDAMMHEVENTPGKSIVWCRFREDIRRVAERLRHEGRGVVEYHGGVSARDREEAVDRFQNDDRVTDFVGQPQAGGRGLDLSAASLVLWYSCTPDAIITAQGDERGTMMGGKAVNIITLATTGTVHDNIVLSNQNKVLLADQVSGRGLRDLLLRTEV